MSGAAPAGGTPVLSLIGGGVSVVALVGDLARALAVEELDVRLAARDRPRLEVLGDACRHQVARRTGWSVTTCGDVAEACRGSRTVVMMVRVGGLEARQADERLSRRFGIPGDEGLGPGGASNARRTLPVLAEVAAVVREVAPGARVLNLIAPLGITSRGLLDGGLDVIGVCELPAVTERGLRAWAPVPLAYAGLNHLGWFWPRQGGISQVDAAVAQGLVDARVLADFGAIPLKYYYWLFDPDAAAGLGIDRGPERTAELIELRDRARSELAADPGRPSSALAARPTPWFSDGLVPLLQAVLDGVAWSGFANVANCGLSVGRPDDVVVEVRASMAAGRLVPVPEPAPEPPAVHNFLDHAAAAEDLLYRSWWEDDDGLLAESFRVGPHHLDRRASQALSRAIRDDARSVRVGAR